MEAKYTAEVTSTGGRTGHIKSSDGILDFEVRPPKAMGGQDDSHTNPEQLFAAGYAACFGSAVNHVALLQKLRVNPTITAKVSIGDKPGGGFMLAVEMAVNISGVELSIAEDIVKQAHQICPYSNATRGNVEVTLTVTSD
ncbi:MAG: organic hydroperoxide resistance protein [Bacteroidales bacterium]|nr:organic hydroperoxide resistance protein [Bacteroidales bacterium]